MMRPKSTARDLPPKMLRRTKRLASGKIWEGYYYNGRDEQGERQEIPLGTDLNEAKRKWAEFECQKPADDTGLMSFIFDRYLRDALPTKAPKTQEDNRSCIKYLRKVFGNAPIESITPQHIAQYRDARGAKAPVRANREVSLLSAIFNMAREWGYTAKENPAKGVRKNKEKPRDYYADDAVWAAVYKTACPELQDAMDINYLTGQRPADVLKMRHADIVDGALEVQQNKTQMRLRILLTVDGVRSELGRVIDRIKRRKVTGLFIVATAKGAGLNKWTLRDRFEKAREDAATAAIEAENEALANKIRKFQFRDIRPKAASEMDLEHASDLLGHTNQQITKRVYQRVGKTVSPTK
jgi:integrase